MTTATSRDSSILKYIGNHSMRRTLILLLLGMSAIPAIADAQTVIMRKPLSGPLFGKGPGGYVPPATGTPTPAPTPAPSPAPVVGTWTTSAPRAITPSCSMTAPAIRDVWCAGPDDALLKDISCEKSGPRPDASTTIEDHAGCGYAWVPGEWRDWSSTCSEAAKRGRSPTCQRSDGATVEANGANCPAADRPKDNESAAIYTGCNYLWKTKTSICDGSGYRDVTYQCERSGGTSTSLVMTSPTDVERCGTMPSSRVADTSCGAPDLIVNGGFENGLSPWTTNTANVIDASEQAFGTGVASGTKALYINQNWWVRQKIVLTPGKKYMVLFSVAASYDTFTVGVGPNTRERTIWTASPGPNWSAYSVTFTAASGDDTLRFTTRNLTYLDAVSVKEVK